MAIARHGHNVGKRTRTYNAWINMRQRCYNPKNPRYSLYGGRGITICPEWDSYVRFLMDMGECSPGHSLDRIDNDKGYSRSNCRWATAQVQSRNRGSAAGSSSRYKGVSWDRSRLSWKAAIKTDGVIKNLGRFRTEEEAAKAYNSAALKLWGDMAVLNKTGDDE